MKDNLKSENEKYMSNNTSCKAMYKIMRLSSINQRLKCNKFINNACK